MLYREAAPAGPAGEFVKCFWMLEDDDASSDVQRILPDGRCELILNFGDSFECYSSNGWSAQPRWFVTGQITGPMLLRGRGKTKVMGIRFHPHGPAQFLGMPIGELTDRVASLDELSVGVSREFEKLNDLPSTTEQFDALDSLVASGPKRQKADRAVAAAVGLIEQTHGLYSIKKMARLTGLSPRQFERRFAAAVGLTPKMFCRMQRFQQVLRAVDVLGANWATAALDCGYYDQSHLIRDFQEFAGSAPTALLTEELQLARRFANQVPSFSAS